MLRENAKYHESEILENALADTMTEAWMTRRRINGELCDVLNERDIRAIEWKEPRLAHIDRCRVTQYGGRIFVYTGIHVMTVRENERWRSMPDLLRIGKKAVKEWLDKNYEPNEIIL